ncbi:MAG TPA: glycoside hydrolase family 2 protein [Opitutus sp.]|nr:glycoside hydrolase family 2 protein [Opitutus sp.]
MPSLSLAPASWHFRDATSKSSWRPAVVPGCVHRDLLRHKLIPDPFWASNELTLQWIEERIWEYRASFTVGRALLEEEQIELAADGLDTVATVIVNGRELARTENMFTGYRWDVKPLLRAGKNEILVRFDSAMNYIRSRRTDHRPREFNDPVGRCTVIRKEQCQFGWDWGPRFVTAGIWQDMRLEAWSGNRLESVRLTQTHGADGQVTLTLAPELARVDARAECRWKLVLERAAGSEEGESRAARRRSSRAQPGGERTTSVQEGVGHEIVVQNPQLWWPNGQGAQPLYRLEVEVADGRGAAIGRWARRIGLRTIRLDRHTDEWGESFQFVVNGRAIFAKGANWIPAHSFVAGLTRVDYARDLASAAEAHMNMIRVWGGGIYETEDFYDLCDELGLLVWQDFMFACTMYPADDAMIASVRAEAEFQVRRLRHRASLALWCGNNEIPGLNAPELADAETKRGYERLFHETLPAAVQAMGPQTDYWPSSPWRGNYENDHAAGEQRGDTHFWDVWHGRNPVSDYQKYRFRFVSEFGMQSFNSPATQATFCPADDANVFGHSMENHQKNRGGNQVILDYVSRRYCFPKSQEALIYLSQLNQAHCMQVGVEHWRRNSPRCMGALYWQLNDCWPVASWSSIEFTGRWRALHHVARRFFAPALVSAFVPGEETTIIGNYRRSDVHEVHLYTVYDAPTPANGVVRWDVFHLDGRALEHGKKAVALRPGESVRQHTIELAKPLAKHTRDSVYVRIALDVDGRRVSEETVFLTPPRFLNLPKAKTKVAVKLVAPGEATIAFTSSAFQHRFEFDLPGLQFRSSDNFFELYPGETKTVSVTFRGRKTADQLRRMLTHQSLVDTY